MRELVVKKYAKSHKELWDDFILNARNGLFLFMRDYMDYHSDRFNDHSLLFFNGNKLVAVLPANEKDGQIITHEGLTFGGVLTKRNIRIAEILVIFQQLKEYLIGEGVNALIYKSIPYIFHAYPAQEDLYCLSRLNAKIQKRELSSVIEIGKKIPFSETKRQLARKCALNNVIVEESIDFNDYWNLLRSVLNKYNVKPVHTLEEICHLKSQFPTFIRLFEARKDGHLLAGIVIYDYQSVVHTQYMANSDEGRKCGALDYLNYILLNEVFSEREFYSFGISTTNGGKELNSGLVLQKELMGGRGVILDTYELSLS